MTKWDQNIVKYAACLLENSGVIAIATDTIYGIFCLYDSPLALAKIYDIKQRDKKKPLVLLTKNLEQAKDFGVFDDLLENLVQNFWPGPLTVVIEAKTTNIFNNSNIGIRVSRNNFINQLISFMGKPVFATSLNISSQAGAINFEDIDPSIKSQLDGIFDISDVEPSGRNSTIVSYFSQKLALLREGEIDFKEINEKYLAIKNSQN